MRERWHHLLAHTWRQRHRRKLAVRYTRSFHCDCPFSRIGHCNICNERSPMPVLLLQRTRLGPRPAAIKTFVPLPHTSGKVGLHKSTAHRTAMPIPTTSTQRLSIRDAIDVHANRHPHTYFSSSDVHSNTFTVSFAHVQYLKFKFQATNNHGTSTPIDFVERSLWDGRQRVPTAQTLKSPLADAGVEAHKV